MLRDNYVERDDFDGTSNNVVDTDEAVWAASSSNVANATTPDVAYGSGATEAVTAETNDLAIVADSTADSTGCSSYSVITGLGRICSCAYRRRH